MTKKRLLNHPFTCNKTPCKICGTRHLNQKEVEQLREKINANINAKRQPRGRQMKLRDKYEHVAMYYYEKTDKSVPFYVWVNQIAEEHSKEIDAIIKHKRSDSSTQIDNKGTDK